MRHNVKMVVAGGVAAAAHGLPHTPNDLDICCECSEPNLNHLVEALEELHVRPLALPGGGRQRVDAIRRARSSGYSWRAILRAAFDWTAGKVRGRGAPGP